MEIEEMLSDLWYQHPQWPSTYSACQNKCGKSARGGRECVECIKKKLYPIIGKELTDRYDDLIVQLRNAKAEIHDTAGYTPAFQANVPVSPGNS